MAANQRTFASSVLIDDDREGFKVGTRTILIDLLKRWVLIDDALANGGRSNVSTK